MIILLPWTLTDKDGFISEGLGVYNGDMGIIIDIDFKAELITVRFDDNRICEYKFDRMESLEHAFAITVHKSQGTEFPAVIILFWSTKGPCMQKLAIYGGNTGQKTGSSGRQPGYNGRNDKKH